MLELVKTSPPAPPRLAEKSDRELLADLARNDERALDELVRRKTRALVQAVARIVYDEEEARDIVQVTFLRLWENRTRYDGRFSPNTWIYRIATNLAIDAWRSKKSRERASEPLRFHVVRDGEAAHSRALAELQASEVGSIFRELSSELPDKQRLVFVLREIEGLSSQEVAEIAGCEESTVRNHLFNARKTLRESLVARFPEYAAAWIRRTRRGAPPELGR